MDLGGILAGAMAGGGKAIQVNAQNQLEQQRQEALKKLDQEFRMDAITYEQDRSDQRSAAQALAEAQQAEADREAEMARLRAEGDQELRLLEREAELDAQYGAGSDRPAKVQEIEYLADNVFGGDLNMATRVAYGMKPMNYETARNLVLDHISENAADFNVGEEEIERRVQNLLESSRRSDPFGRARSGGSSQGNNSVFSFGRGSTLTTLPNGSVSTTPSAGTGTNLVDPNVLMSDPNSN